MSEESAGELREIEALKQLKARYFRLMDTKQWDEFAQVLAPDVEIDVTDDAGEAGRVQGRDRFVRLVRRAVGEAQTVHHGHMPEIELTGPDTARGIWAMFDYVEFAAGPPRRGLRGYGHYEERYAKREGRWEIAAMTLRRLRIDPLS